jgi:UDP-N-acetylglucosamine diphosphorylase / glucose-1-phosphate thymidylyltransferase / UDP-N-acetylgalactosamine diphosphorylase / glucosamine-1-phosphate N-acetyltransferase / galactosamine-1-phosphate N-acetyltransferase
MSQPALVIFDDDRGRFGPLTDLRAAFELRGGALLNWQRIQTALRLTLRAAHTRPALAPLVAQRIRQPVNTPLDALGHDQVLLVNGRWPADAHIDAIGQLNAASALVNGDGSVIAARLTPAEADFFLNRAQLPAHTQRNVAPPDMLIERPWHLLTRMEAMLLQDLQEHAPAGLPRVDTVADATIAGDFPVRAAAGAGEQGVVVEPGARLLSYDGPIVLEAGVRIGANAVIYGPCWIGPGSQIRPQAVIGPVVAIGPHCKVGGEVKHASLHGCTNKTHNGFLGHAIVGEWVNFGADTTASNLKNTYGTVRVQLDADAEPEDTGLTFHGPVIGDHVLTAIGTRLATGTCIGTGAMLALSTFAPKYVKPMHFHTDVGMQPYDIEGFITTARRRMARRGLEPDDALVNRWRELAGDSRRT